MRRPIEAQWRPHWRRVTQRAQQRNATQRNPTQPRATYLFGCALADFASGGSARQSVGRSVAWLAQPTSGATQPVRATRCAPSGAERRRVLGAGARKAARERNNYLRAFVFFCVCASDRLAVCARLLLRFSAAAAAAASVG